MTRIEGDSALIVTREKDRITNVIYNMPTARDFKGVIIGQQVKDLPKIVPRICGICPVAHRIGAVKAIESASEVSIPPVAELLRELALLGEIIRSHTYSVFFSTLPDIMYLTDQISRQDILGIDRTQPRLLPIAIKLYNCAETLITATAGNTNMAFNLIPGGLMQNITITQQQELIQQLHATLSGIKWTKEYYGWLLNEIEGEIQKYTLPQPRYISCFDTHKNRFYGTDQIEFISEDGSQSKFSCAEFSEFLVEQDLPEAPTKIIYAESNKRLNNLLAGPHARLAALQTKSTKSKESLRNIPNLFYSGLLRIDEIEFAITNAIKLLETEWQTGEDVSVALEPQISIGASAVEAPRGTLLYRININDVGRIEDIDIRVPTELNASAITLIVKKVMTACLDLGWSNDQILERAKMAVRCFDPCVSCATHTDIRFRD
ncbi:MAG: nickel-dependent hydrogenase large subunit [Candidatus Hermodarchaeota archaeon]|nr:nickel-dependent hydrogenase large subunit [Candidatus Hermodarchaeota archaeon]